MFQEAESAFRLVEQQRQLASWGAPLRRSSAAGPATAAARSTRGSRPRSGFQRQHQATAAAGGSSTGDDARHLGSAAVTVALAAGLMLAVSTVLPRPMLPARTDDRLRSSAVASTGVSGRGSGGGGGSTTGGKNSPAGGNPSTVTLTGSASPVSHGPTESAVAVAAEADHRKVVPNELTYGAILAAKMVAAEPQRRKAEQQQQQQTLNQKSSKRKQRKHKDKRLMRSATPGGRSAASRCDCQLVQLAARFRLVLRNIPH